MKKILIILLIVLTQSSHAEGSSVGKEDNSTKLTSSICATTNSGEAEVEFYKRQNSLIEYLSKNKEKIDSIGWGVNTSSAINKINESHQLWLKHVAIDCELWAYSPLNAGSKNEDEVGCWCDNYISRIEQINEYEEAWLGVVP